MSLSVAGDRKTAYISQIRPFNRVGYVAECHRLSARLSAGCYQLQRLAVMLRHTFVDSRGLLLCSLCI